MSYNAKHDSPMRALRRRVWAILHPNRRMSARELRRLGINKRTPVLLAVGGSITH